MMITFEDCLAVCSLTQAEILAIAEHEHIPEIAAAGLGRYLLDSPGGPERIREMILDDIAPKAAATKRKAPAPPKRAKPAARGSAPRRPPAPARKSRRPR